MKKGYSDIWALFIICVAIAGIVVSVLIGYVHGKPIVNDPSDPEAWVPQRNVWQVGEQDAQECSRQSGCLVITAQALQFLIDRVNQCGQKM